jgi:hypothetical protein
MARILLIATHGSEDPMRAGLAFLFAKGTVEASHRPEMPLCLGLGFLRRLRLEQRKAVGRHNRLYEERQ